MYHHIEVPPSELAQLAASHRKLLSDMDSQAERAVSLAVRLANRVRELEAENANLRRQLNEKR